MKGLILPGLDGDACDMDTLHFLYGLVGYLRPSLIVEAGTYRGHGSSVMGEALRANKIDGEVWSADVEGYDAAQTVTQNDLQDYVTLYRGDFKAMLDGPLVHRKIRMAFVDSGRVVLNDGEKVADDVRSTHVWAAYERLAPGGVVVVDDMNGQWVGVEDIRQRASVYLTTGRGMAIVQRR